MIRRYQNTNAIIATLFKAKSYITADVYISYSAKKLNISKLPVVVKIYKFNSGLTYKRSDSSPLHFKIRSNGILYSLLDTSFIHLSCLG